MLVKCLEIKTLKHVGLIFIELIMRLLHDSLVSRHRMTFIQ